MPAHDIIDNRKEKLVKMILSAKQPDTAADTSALEREIDQHVCRIRRRHLAWLGYRLYGLMAAETKIVEEGAGK